MSRAKKTAGAALVALVALVAAMFLAAPAQAAEPGDDTATVQQPAPGTDDVQTKGADECTLYLEVRGYDVTVGMKWGCFTGTFAGANGYAACVGILKFEDVKLRHAALACGLAKL
ncbi:hypothetical protein [Streptomyces sp. NPDC059009]|uniref:hypothetical protein n=1 Tax=Streptomyces sp. NPDC059009 TaxID=3346694 RepID=UPI0036A3D256